MHEARQGYESTTRGTLRGADTVIDRADIELEAWQLIDGRSSTPAEAAMHIERRDNARTALFEALTASGHLSRIEIDGSLEEINSQVLNRLLNGWDESLPDHEKKRRFAELCEELTIQKVHRLIVAGELPEDTVVHINSDFPETMASPQRLGYRPWNKKGMARSTHLERGPMGYKRVIEQVSRSNGTPDSSRPLLDEAGVCLSAGPPGDVAVMNAVLLYRRVELPDGVIDIQRRLDAPRGTLFGDYPGAVQHIPYEHLRAESQNREKRLEFFVDKLADYAERLDRALANGAISAKDRDAMFGREVQQILRAICVLAPEYATDTFGAKAAAYYYKASDMVARGDTRGARLLLLEARGSERPVIYCGAAISNEEAKALGIKIDDLGNIIEEGKEAMEYTDGYCRIPKCPSQPGQTKVGPCSVCRKCQAIFDKPGNLDPAKIYDAVSRGPNYKMYDVSDIGADERDMGWGSLEWVIGKLATTNDVNYTPEDTEINTDEIDNQTADGQQKSHPHLQDDVRRLEYA